MTNVTDANTQPTNLTYDSMWRVTNTGYADGGSISTAYTNYVPGTPPTWATITGSTLVSAGAYHHGTQTLDGLGRVIHSTDTSAGSTVDTTYNNLGQVYSVSNPYASTSDSTYGLTRYIYDALGRPCVVIPPDGTTVSNCSGTPNTGDVLISYAANCVTVTDQQGKARQTCSDALGRTISVNEDPGGLNYATTYSYDALDNLIGVNQSGQTRSYNYDMLSRLTSATTPESGTTSFSYDANGNVLTRADARNITTSYSYDALNRLTSKSYNDTPRTLTANYFYDVATPNLSNWTGGTLGYPIGRLAYTCTAPQTNSCASLSTASVTGYDAMGRPADYWQCTPLNCSTPSVWKMHYTYDLAGDLTSWSHPSGTTITYGFNGAQQVSQVNDSISDSTHPGLIATASYTPFGTLNTLTNGCVGTGCAQIQQTYTYNNRLQPVMMELGTAGNVAANYCQVYNYYSSVGNPTSCAVPTQGTGNNGNLMGSYLSDASYPAQNHQMTYTFDTVNRLSTATAQTLGGTPSTIWSQTTSYDQWGNMTCSGSGICASMTYKTGTNHLATLGNQAVSYDASGNLTQDGTVSGTYRQYSFDAEGHATKQIDTSGSVETDTYNALGQVVESDWPTWQIQDTWDAFGTSLAEWTPMDGQWWGPGIHLGVGGMNLAWDAYFRGRPQQTVFLHKDYLGSTRQVTTYSGATGSDLLFYPWGDIWAQQGPSYEQGFAGFLGTTDTDEVLYGTPNRQYAHVMGRWLSPDPLAGDVSNPQSLNRYAYVLNNPIDLVDPLGLDGQYTGATCGTLQNCMVMFGGNWALSLWSPDGVFCGAQYSACYGNPFTGVWIAFTGSNSGDIYLPNTSIDKETGQPIGTWWPFTATSPPGPTMGGGWWSAYDRALSALGTVFRGRRVGQSFFACVGENMSLTFTGSPKSPISTTVSSGIVGISGLLLGGPTFGGATLAARLGIVAKVFMSAVPEDEAAEAALISGAVATGEAATPIALGVAAIGLAPLIGSAAGCASVGVFP